MAKQLSAIRHNNGRVLAERDDSILEEIKVVFIPK